MIRVNLSTGETLTFDLEDEGSSRRWRESQADRGFQSRVRTVQIVHERVETDPDGTEWVTDRVRFVCPRPSGQFREVTWDADLVHDPKRDRTGQERVHCYAGKVKMTLTVYRFSNPVTARVDLSRPGRRVLLPPTG